MAESVQAILPSADEGGSQVLVIVPLVSLVIVEPSVFVVTLLLSDCVMVTAIEAVSVHVTLLSDAGGSHVWVTAPVVSLVIVEPS